MAPRKLKFTKMHGLGNDYVYVNCLTEAVDGPEKLSERISSRHFGIGADGLVLILPSTNADFAMRMFNADGSESQMCGNAVRCIAKYVYERGLTKAQSVSVETLGGIKQLELNINDGIVETVTVDMGEPILEASKIPTTFSGRTVVAKPVPQLPQELRATCVSVGNPHAIFFVPEITDELVLGLGPTIERLAAFPERVNVEFVTVQSRSEMTMRVWERGSGETMACGTGAAAVAVAGVLNDLTNREVTVHLRGGDLSIRWDEKTNHVFKTGPAAFVFDGEIDL